TTLLAAGSAFLLSSRMTPVYQSVTKVLINEAPANKSADYTSVLTSVRLAQTYSELLTTRPVWEGVVDQLDLDISADELRAGIAVQPVQDTQLIEVSLEDTDPQRAALVLNTLVQVFAQQNRALQEERFAASKANLSKQLEDMNNRILQVSAELDALADTEDNQDKRTRLEATQSQYRQIYSSLLLSFEQVRLAEAQSTSNLVQVEPAQPNNVPIRPKTMTNTALAGLIGLFLGVAVAILTDVLDDTLKGTDDVTRHLGVPVLGLIARYDRETKLITAAMPRSPVAEAFRSLRTNLQFASVDYPLHSLLVTSPSPSDGKSTIAANLAIVLAQGGHQVALVDADLRRPNVHKIVGLPNRRGVSSLFVQPHVDLNGSLQQTAVTGLTAMTAGDIPPNPAELLGSEKMIDILGKVRERVDVVVVDSPPVMAVTDSAVLASRVDGVLLVLKPGSTNLAAARQAVEQLRRVGANILGVVLNEVDLGRSRYKYYRYRGYYYSYHYYYEDGRPTQRGNGFPSFRKAKAKTSK
ncbi:MAG: polysaccharide biosynthesis tyrosine autokinase, partial [Chloroflexi bacterium]|nr:polysaccharide biosynthesis tyrosine autokinase [Chloroflexota bacterium]